MLLKSYITLLCLKEDILLYCMQGLIYEFCDLEHTLAKIQANVLCIKIRHLSSKSSCNKFPLFIYGVHISVVLMYHIRNNFRMKLFTKISKTARHFQK